ncbi:hypothetical protein K505DRAFT_326662 [Melanomma pulvis-pyrius CBS 109.77]|uniref:Secreted protein n=1 Tax=Melanomma pulvis-pyrius CBS 109.77 TaxID=1314802 RepID=A0A6A6X648_9PLEO|nr:hypothetical protein K505DRAFT_326662 [Melanomma pulvis-pyrius CBS 109.77]
MFIFLALDLLLLASTCSFLHLVGAIHLRHGSELPFLPDHTGLLPTFLLFLASRSPRYGLGKRLVTSKKAPAEASASRIRNSKGSASRRGRRA